MLTTTATIRFALLREEVVAIRHYLLLLTKLVRQVAAAVVVVGTTVEHESIGLEQHPVLQFEHGSIPLEHGLMSMHLKIMPVGALSRRRRRKRSGSGVLGTTSQVRCINLGIGHGQRRGLILEKSAPPDLGNGSQVRCVDLGIRR